MKKHEPDFENLRRVLLRQGPPGPVPLFEIVIEPAVIGAVLGEKMPLSTHVYGPQAPPLKTEDDAMKGVKSLDMLVRFCVEMGYDFVFIFTVPNLPCSFVGMDGKHSFEDTIMPVEEVFERWSDRISILEGVDVGLLTRATPEQVRARTRQILDACRAKGTAYALGSGNSICAFMPREGYLAMVDEWRRCNEEHFGAA
jgi:hypothetical protein